MDSPPAPRGFGGSRSDGRADPGRLDGGRTVRWARSRYLPPVFSREERFGVAGLVPEAGFSGLRPAEPLQSGSRAGASKERRVTVSGRRTTGPDLFVHHSFFVGRGASRTSREEGPSDGSSLGMDRALRSGRHDETRPVSRGRRSLASWGSIHRGGRVVSAMRPRRTEFGSF